MHFIKQHTPIYSSTQFYTLEYILIYIMLVLNTHICIFMLLWNKDNNIYYRYRIIIIIK